MSKQFIIELSPNCTLFAGPVGIRLTFQEKQKRLICRTGCHSDTSKTNKK